MAKRKDNVLLVDADVLCYGIAFGNQAEVDWDGDGETEVYVTPEKALVQVEEFIRDLERKLKGTETILILSEYPGFRQELDETYKANRKGEKPALWQTIRDFIEFGGHGWSVESRPRLEGDDVLGILHTSPEYRGRSTIVTIDKDLNTVPGRVFFWNSDSSAPIDITPLEAAHFHLTQVITGDQVDNYKGLPRCGPVAASKALDHLTSAQDMWDAVVELYESKGYTEQDAIHQARLAFILRDGWYDHDTHKVKLWNPKFLTKSGA